MNILIKIFAFILMSTSAIFANNTPTEGSTLQVIASSGLKLRMAPSMNAGTITVMPMGAEVELLEFSPEMKLVRVEWIDGHWMKVEYNGQVGWAFDGFLTQLEVPEHDLEKCYEDLALIYPLEYWTRAHYGAESIDTLTDNKTYTKTKYYLTNNQRLVITERDYSNELELHLRDVRVMEVYQLLQSMIIPKKGKQEFMNSSLFIEKDGTVKHIKIDILGGIDIRESYDGTVRVLMSQGIEGC